VLSSKITTLHELHGITVRSQLEKEDGGVLFCTFSPPS